MELNLRQLAVLQHLFCTNKAMTGSAIIKDIWNCEHFTSIEQGQRACKQLESRGLVKPKGLGFRSAQKWIITPEGINFITERIKING